MSSNRPPFVNLVDVAGIIMLCIILCAFLALLGSKLITIKVIAVLCILFAGAIFFAKRGAP